MGNKRDKNDRNLPAYTAEDLAQISDQEYGRVRNGNVELRSFDEGMILTLGATLFNNNYFLEIPNITYAPGLPGVPVTFGNPEEIFEKFMVPAVVIRRDDLYPAMQRWHPGSTKYRVPALDAHQITVTVPGGTVTGYDNYEEQYQAIPFDIMYTLNVIGRHRGMGGKNVELLGHSNKILGHCLKKFQPYGSLLVYDDQNDPRTYECFMEGAGSVDSTSEVAHRVVGFAMTIRIEGELDQDDPHVRAAVTGLPQVTYSQIARLRTTHSIGILSGSSTETTGVDNMPEPVYGIFTASPGVFARFSDVVVGPQGPITVDAGLATVDTTRMSLTIRTDKAVTAGTITARLGTQAGNLFETTLTQSINGGLYTTISDVAVALTNGDLVTLELQTSALYSHSGLGVAAVKVAAQFS